MSPLWRDHIQVFIAPERLDLLRVSHRIRRLGRSAQDSRVIYSCERGPDQQVWEAPLKILESLIQEEADTEMTITLSNHFLRYVTLPPQTEITKPDEVDSYALFRLREIYGERADNWKHSISAWSPLEGAVCAAIDSSLIKRLEEITKRHRIKLKNIEPYLASVFDSCKQQLQGSSIYFALVETGRICTALLINGIWQNIRNQKVLNDMENELLAVLDQEAVLYEQRESSEQVYLFAPEHPEFKLPVGCSWRISSLQPMQSFNHALYPLPEDINSKVSVSA